MSQSGSGAYFCLCASFAVLTALSPPAQAKPCVGLVPATSVGDFWQAVNKGANDAARTLGYDIIFRSSSLEAHDTQQLKIIQLIRKAHCNGLLLAPNSSVVSEHIARYRKQGFYTVYFDRNYGDSAAIGTFATDNLKAGARAAQFMHQKLSAQSKVVVFKMDKNVRSTSDREKGFITEIRRLGHTVVAEPYIGETYGEGVLAIKQFIQQNARFHGVFTPNESTTTAAVTALAPYQNSPLSVLHIGFDANKRLLKALKAHHIHGLVIQNPYKMGYLGMHALHKALQGEVPDKPEFMDTGVVVAHPDNLTTPDVQKLLVVQ